MRLLCQICDHGRDAMDSECVKSTGPGQGSRFLIGQERISSFSDLTAIGQVHYQKRRRGLGLRGAGLRGHGVLGSGLSNFL